MDFNGCSSLTTIGTDAFANNDITSVEFVDLSSLTTIGFGAFSGNSIVSVVFDGLSSLVTIDSYAFYSNSIISVDFCSCPSLTTIGDNAFDSNPLLSIVYMTSDIFNQITVGSNTGISNSIIDTNCPIPTYTPSTTPGAVPSTQQPSPIITTIAGTGSTTYSGDNGQATAAGLASYGVALDAAGE